MIIVEINSVLKGSTGKIARQIADNAILGGNQAYICVPKGRHNKKTEYNNAILFGSQLSEDSHIILNRITGLNGCFSIIATLSLICKINRINPDVVHLHNLHNCYINLPILFRYLRNNNVKVVWTLHDCWSFTGQCPHFTSVNCSKWETGCYKCPSYREYPESFVDRTRLMWRLKRKWFTGLKHMVIVTPSEWLAHEVKKSYLNEYRIKVVNNGIDLNTFRPSRKLNTKEKYNIPKNKYIVLGVASNWGYRKGLDVFSELVMLLPSNYQLVLVGTDKYSEKEIPDTIISINRTHNQEELASLYSCADVFVNPTREDNFPTVNIESIACGTPVITFKTGGSPEIIDETCGCVVECNDVRSLAKKIMWICTEKPYLKESCLNRAQKFDSVLQSKEYFRIYENCTCNSECSI